MNREGCAPPSGTPEACTALGARFTQTPVGASLSVPQAHGQPGGWGGTSHLSPPRPAACCGVGTGPSPLRSGAGQSCMQLAHPCQGQASGSPPEPAAPRPQPWGQTRHPLCVWTEVLCPLGVRQSDSWKSRRSGWPGARIPASAQPSRARPAARADLAALRPPTLFVVCICPLHSRGLCGHCHAVSPAEGSEFSVRPYVLET